MRVYHDVETGASRQPMLQVTNASTVFKVIPRTTTMRAAVEDTRCDNATDQPTINIRPKCVHFRTCCCAPRCGSGPKRRSATQLSYIHPRRIATHPRSYADGESAARPCCYQFRPGMPDAALSIPPCALCSSSRDTTRRATNDRQTMSGYSGPAGPDPSIYLIERLPSASSMHISHQRVCPRLDCSKSTTLSHLPLSLGAPPSFALPHHRSRDQTVIRHSFLLGGSLLETLFPLPYYSWLNVATVL